MKITILSIFLFFFVTLEIIKAQDTAVGFYKQSSSGVGFFRIERSNDHYFQNHSLEIEIHGTHEGWIIIQKDLPSPILRTNEFMIFQKLISLTPNLSTTALRFTLQFSNDGQTFYDAFPRDMGTSEVGQLWTPDVLGLQGSLPNYINKIRIKFRCYYLSSPQDSIRTILRLDYWTASYYSYPQRIIEDFEGGVNSIIPINSETPEKFSLTQNYPNPFNPKTYIHFSIPKRSYVELKVYSILGEEIETLVNKELIAGTYKVDFDGTRLSSGTYFYRIRAGDFTETKKLVLVK